MVFPCSSWRRVTAAVCSLFIVTSITHADGGSPFFDQTIAPILVEHCLSCHSGENPKGKFDLTSEESAARGGESGFAILAGDLDASLFWQHIKSDEMPPENPLPDSAKESIRRWIESGAQWGLNPLNVFQITTESRAGYDWWSLQPISRPTAPHVAGVDHPIDALVRARLADASLSASRQASSLVIIRRLHFDLLGLPPSPEMVREFEQSMKRHPDVAIARLIDRLLASNQFGQRWARHWLDVVRFGESEGFERDKLRNNSWYYRDWVIEAFNNDMPYDQFVRQQLAGDVLNPDNADAIIATGFLVAGPWDEVGQNQQSPAMKAIVRQDEIEDYVGTIGQAFLGLTVNCARCHDHKFDPITQKEYYRMAAAISAVHHGSRDVTDTGGARFSVYAAKPSKPETTHLLARGNAAEKLEMVAPGGIAAVAGVNAEFGVSESGSDSDRRRALANWITSDDNPLFARVIVNRLWHYHFGSGIVGTPNDFGFSGGQPSHPELLDYLASELIESGYRLKHIHRLIVSSETYLQASRFRADCAAVDAGNQLLWRKDPTRLDAETLRDTILSVAGQLNSTYGGPSYQDFKTHVHNSQFYEMVDRDSAEVYRRTIYRTWIRSGRNHLLDVFDCPDPSTTAPKRSMTTTPLQALTLMNNSFVMRMSDRFATRVVNDSGKTPMNPIERIYALAYGRQPMEDERNAATMFIDTHGLSAFCRVILNSNEFIHVD